MTVVISGGDFSSLATASGATPAAAAEIAGSSAYGSRTSTMMGRSSRGAMRQSGARLRTSDGIAGHSTAGGQPFAGADPNSTRLDIKHRFEITAKLGSGTYGKVSLAYDHKTEREVAVKLIRKSAIENKQDLVRIRREIRIMSMLKHPNIIQIYEVFENKDKIILVMEYANGGELYDYVSKFGSLPEAEARRIFRQITSAVLYCHKHKVVHRDLKLENILLDARNNAKIADFGLSNYFNEKSLLATFCGSPLYASPEIINGTPYRGPEVDCWSLGILLYTLVYGSMPFDGRDFNRMVRQIKRGAYYEPDTPSTASMLIRNMLRVNPDRRADIDEIASHWWLNLEENMPVIQELPENQITDHTPLTERAEIMVVQDLADETDVFMEFGHLSAATRQKIEEFRRRRKEAEEYNENSPVKHPKHRRTSLKGAGVRYEQPEMSAKEKNLRDVKEEPIHAIKMDSSAFQDPLDRLRQLEIRLQGAHAPVEKAVSQKPETSHKTSDSEKEKGGGRDVEPALAAAAGDDVTPASPTAAYAPKQKRKKSLKSLKQNSIEAKSAKIKQKAEEGLVSKSMEERPPAFTSATRSSRRKDSDTSASSAPSDTEAALKDVRQQTRQYWKMGTDSLNLLMNQVLEQMEKGPVSLNLVARIKAHAFYDQRPMVKELLESIITAQPAVVQKETSKILQQQSQNLIRRQTSAKSVLVDNGGMPMPSSTIKPPAITMETVLEATVATVAKSSLSSKKPPLMAGAREKYRVAELPNQPELKRSIRKVLDDRPWHSVEVGFSTDDDSSSNNTDSGGAIDYASTERGDGTHKMSGVAAAPKFIGTRITRSVPLEDEFELDDEEEDEYFDAEDEEEEYESEIDELADEVEQATRSSVEVPPQKPAQPAAYIAHESATRHHAAPPKIVENLTAEKAPQSPIGTGIDARDQNLNQLSAGLAKRQSKGKYQFLHHQMDLYGRGVSMETESPPVSRRRIGGPQPLVEQLPILFDKAKNYLINYPNKLDYSDEDDDLARKSKSPARKPIDAKIAPAAAKRLEATQKIEEKTIGKVIIKTPPTEENEEEEEEEEEESDEDGSITFRPRPSTIIGFRTIQPAGAYGVAKEAPIVKVKPQVPSNGIPMPIKKNSVSEAFSATSSPPHSTGAPNSAASDATRRFSFRQNSQNSASFDGSRGIALTSAGPPLAADTVDAGGNYADIAPIAAKPHESAAAYIRRKNRERRARNQTIAVAAGETDAWSTRSGDESSYPATVEAGYDSALSARRKSSFTGASRLSTERVLEAPGERRSSYFDERRFEPNYLRQAYMDRRKSFHELTPSRDPGVVDESRCFSPTYAPPTSAYERYAGASDAMHYGVALPSSISRYEEEIFHAFYPNAAHYGHGHGHGDMTFNDPSYKRFEVYRTRAERATDASYGADYRKGGTSFYYYGSDRPSSAYVSARYGEGYASAREAQRRSLYEPDYSAIASTMDYIGVGAYAPPDSPGGTSSGSASKERRTAAVAAAGCVRRISSTSRDAEAARRLRARSQSNDRMLAVVIRDDFDASNEVPFFNPHLMTPEVSNNAEYAIGGRAGAGGFHHDASSRAFMRTAAGDVDVSASGQHHRSPLKSKQSFDSDTRTSYLPAVKEPIATGSRFTDTAADPSTNVQKKRSFLNLARRRTTEVTTNTFLADEDYKRPRSPIDRLKSFFRAGKKEGRVHDVAATAGGPIGYSSTSRYTGGVGSSSGVTSSRYGTSTTLDVGGGYGSASGYGSATSLAASKRYGAASSSRYGYSGGSTASSAKSSPRNWYDDPHHY